MNLAEKFLTVLKEFPQYRAVVKPGCIWNYEELDRAIRQIQKQLKSYNLLPQTAIALLVDDPLWLAASIWAVIRERLIYVVLDGTYPQERLAYILEDSQASLLIIDEEMRSGHGALIDSVPHHVINIEDSPLSPEIAYLQSCEKEDIVTLYYTSGSTGKPKGVIHNHATILHEVRIHTATLKITPGDRFSAIYSLATIGSNRDFYAAILNGASWNFFPFRLYGMSALKDWIEAEKITILHAIPILFRELNKTSGHGKFDSVRVVFLAGDRVLPDDVLLFRENFSTGACFYTGIGASEATSIYTHWFVPREESLDYAFLPSGYPIPEKEVFLVNDDHERLSSDEEGEIAVCSYYLSPGYFGKEELTRKAFEKREDGSAVYFTGDQGRFDERGRLVFIGRKDYQVKINGFRVELAEVEAVLKQHPQVDTAVVIATEGETERKKLVAYVVSLELIDKARLREYLREKLPDYMVPAVFVFLDSLPLTPNGKIDRKALPSPEEVAISKDYIAPRTPLEQQLAEIWAEVLHLEQVGIHDNFFELGGHSLLAVVLLERMRQAGLSSDVRTFFMTPTIAQLVAAVSTSSGVVEVPPNCIPPGCDHITPEMLPLVQLTSSEIQSIAAAVPGGTANIQDIYPLAPLQEGILFHYLLASEGDLYLLSSWFGFDSRVRLQQYLQALQAVIDRHDILRTAVLWEGVPNPVQVVWRQAPLVVEEVSLVQTEGDVCEQLRQRFDPRRYRLDVRQAPLMRVVVAQDVANGRWLMLQLFHHLALDHTTREVLEQEVQAHLQGRAEQLPSPLPFRNFIAQARLGVSEAEHKAFFQEMLGDVDEPTLPFGLTNVYGDGLSIAEGRCSVDESLAVRLRERVRMLGVSAASVFHLAWAQVLARVSGRDDVVFGTVLFGRMQGGRGADRVLGLFINTLPVRIQLGEVGAQEGIQRTHVLLGQLLRHEHASLAMAQGCGAVAPPLFSALLNYRYSASASQVPLEAFQALGGIEALEVEEPTNYPLTLSVDDLGKGFKLTVQVQSPIDPQRVCAFMHTALEQLVDALERAPATPLCQLDVLPAAERHQLLVDWNQTQTDYPRDKCIHQLFEEQVERTPDAIAVVFEDQQLTYQELNHRANQLAHYLQSLGVEPEQLVGICLERSPLMLVALLAILKAGGAYVPLDPTYPQEPLSFMLEDTQVPVLLTQQSLVEKLPTNPAHVICLDMDWEKINCQDENNPTSRATADNLAYVTYTSGSTGKPKGVCAIHRGVVRLVKGVDYANLNSEETFLQLAPISFDASTFEIWGSLLNGARLALFPNHTPSLEELGQAIRRYQVTTLWLTAGLFHLMVDERLEDLKPLRQLLAGGDVLSVSHVQKFLQEPGYCQLINGYGPTENTTFTCCYRIAKPSQLGTSVPIGRPISNTQIYILDRYLNPAPIGVSGELYIGGDGLARGYLNRPDLTTEKFIPNPFNNSKLYKTGDLARYLPDGNIEFLGRIDNQVKIRGFRIELGEIEAVLSQHPWVAQTVVIDREDTPGDKRLVAYLVPNDLSLIQTQLRDFLKQKVPDYMIPSAFVFVETLPLTPNGKVDRHALPAPDQTRLEPEGTFVAPRDELELQLTKIWEKVLNIQPIGVRDNFFDLGGHSLLAVKLLAQIEKTMGKTLPLATLFQAPTVEDLAKVLGRKNGTALFPSLVPINSLGTKLPLFLCQGAMIYQPLSSYLGSEQPVYGLITQNKQGKQIQFNRLEELAASYIEIIKTVQPQGPYLLGGVSFGGIIAFEMAQQLSNQGQKVALLALFDTVKPGAIKSLPLNQKIIYNLSQLLKNGLNYFFKKIKKRVRGFYGKIAFKIPLLRLKNQEDLLVKEAFLQEVNSYITNYVPQVYFGKITLFTASDTVRNDNCQVERCLGWTDLAVGGLQIDEIPGTHLGILKEPGVQILAEKLRASIDNSWGDERPKSND